MGTQIVVADASGHGMAAGLLMAIANATLGLAVDLDPSPPAVLRLLNRTLCRRSPQRAVPSSTPRPSRSRLRCRTVFRP